MIHYYYPLLFANILISIGNIMIHSEKPTGFSNHMAAVQQKAALREAVGIQKLREFLVSMEIMQKWCWHDDLMWLKQCHKPVITIFIGGMVTI